MMSWQPIETAPKDGTRILGGYDPSIYGDAPVQIVHWFKHPYKQETFYTDAQTTPYWVTHWMPLPAAPEVNDPARDAGITTKVQGS